MYLKDKLQNEGYLYGSSCKSHPNYSLAKRFINQYISDDDISLQDSCYYLNNYNHLQKRGGHRYARPSYASKFVLKNHKQYFHKGQRQYCYHGTHPNNLKSILQNGLKVPDGKNIKVQNGSLYGNGIYSTKIPEYAQFYAPTILFEGKFCQILLLLRQDLNDLQIHGEMDVYGQFSAAITKGPLNNLKNIHLLHSKLIGKTDIQYMTKKENSIVIQAVLVKIHQQQPIKGQYVRLNKMLYQMSE